MMIYCPHYNEFRRTCKIGKDECIGDEYHPENCDVYVDFSTGFDIGDFQAKAKLEDALTEEDQ